MPYIARVTQSRLSNETKYEDLSWLTQKRLLFYDTKDPCSLGCVRVYILHSVSFPQEQLPGSHAAAASSFDVAPLRRFRRPRRPSWRSQSWSWNREVDTSVVSDRYRRLEEELFDHKTGPASASASTELLAAEFASRF